MVADEAVGGDQGGLPALVGRDQAQAHPAGGVEQGLGVVPAPDVGVQDDGHRVLVGGQPADQAPGQVGAAAE